MVKNFQARALDSAPEQPGGEPKLPRLVLAMDALDFLAHAMGPADILIWKPAPSLPSRTLCCCALCAEAGLVQVWFVMIENSRDDVLRALQEQRAGAETFAPRKVLRAWRDKALAIARSRD